MVDISSVRAYLRHVTPHPIYKHIGAFIKARRKTLGMKQETLAKELGISRGSLANIEIGRQSILVHQLYRFAEKLQLPPFDLLPPPSNRLETDRTELPLPEGLKAQQKEQVAQFFSLVDTSATREKETIHGKPTKR